MNQAYQNNPRTCVECGADLFPNFMEGCWEHFAKGCRFSGKAADIGWDDEEMLGPFRFGEQFMADKEMR